MPVTLCKSPAAKKALYGGESELSQDNFVVSALSELINEQADSIEKLVNENSTKKIDGNLLKIEGLKKTVDFVCGENKDTQTKVTNVDSRLKEEELKVTKLLTRVSDLESYSRRWNLKLYGICESQNENVKEKVVELCHPPRRKA